MRVNIDDSIYRDPRFLDLCHQFAGDRFRALGALVVAWDLAQRFYLKSEHHNIPREEWLKQGLPKEILKCGLAHEDERGNIRVAGRDKYCEHLEKLQKAGKIGGLQKASNAKLKLASPSSSKPNVPSSSFSSSRKTKSLLSADADVTRVFNEYPKRKGDQNRKQGLDKLIKLIEAGKVTLEDAILAAKNYKAHCDREGKTGTEYVPMFSSWVNQHRFVEWITPPNQAAPPPPRPALKPLPIDVPKFDASAWNKPKEPK